jgi:tetratricopeptide (TPR) repeat protein
MMSRSSTFRYKGKGRDPQTVGRELGVRAVLTGRVIPRGDQLYISAELVDVLDNSHLWGDQYNLKLADLLILQEEITREISQALRLALTGEDEKRLTKRYTKNTEAHQLYLKGRYYSTKWMGADIRKGMDYLHQAIARDPDYALAYAGLAACYYDGSGELFPHSEALPKARQAAEKALALDESLAEAHVALGMVKLLYDWDWPAAERAFKRAVELNPNYAEAYQWHSEYDLIVRQFDEAIANARKAQELDPLSPLTNFLYAAKFYMARRYDRAIAQFGKTLELDPAFEFALRWMGYAFLQKGMHEKAVNVMQQAVTASGGHELSRLGLAYAYAVSGANAQARTLLADFLEQTKESNYRPFYTALVYVGLGQNDQALQWLQKAYKARDELVTNLHIDPRMDSLRSDPGFAELTEKIGLGS